MAETERDTEELLAIEKLHPELWEALVPNLRRIAKRMDDYPLRSKVRPMWLSSDVATVREGANSVERLRAEVRRLRSELEEAKRNTQWRVVTAVSEENERLRAEMEGIRETIVAAVTAGRAAVDEALREYGYDSLRFADVRHGWLATVKVLESASPDALNEAVNRLADAEELEEGDDDPQWDGRCANCDHHRMQHDVYGDCPLCGDECGGFELLTKPEPTP